MMRLAEPASRSIDPHPQRLGAPEATRSNALSGIGAILEDRDGVFTGTISNDPDAHLDAVVIAVERRAIEIVPVAFDESAALRQFRYDLRYLPPYLLLNERLRIEVRPQQQPNRLLAAREIETAHIFPSHDLPGEQGRLEGYIDSMDADVVRGWVWDPTAGQRRIKLHLFVDGAFRGIFEATTPRPDLAATGRGDGRYGFAIPTGQLVERAGAVHPRIEVVSIEPEYWRVPLAPHLQPAQQARRPNFRRVPQTTRELVALLASSEPLPKKVFALDRMTRMPDAFSADYLGLGLEFLRVELVAADATSRSLGGRLSTWLRRRKIQNQIARLTSLVDAAVASQRIIERAFCATSRRSHEGP